MTEELDYKRLIKSLAYAGLDFSEEERLSIYIVAKKCSRSAGISMGAFVGLASAKVGAVAIPGVGAVPGWVAGMLAGFLSGTVMCTIAHYPIKEELDKLLARNSGEN